MDEKKALDMKELEQVTGGWEFQTDNKYLLWLNGYNVKCPYCGNEDAGVVERKAASPSEVLFKCANCQKSFFLRYNRLYKKINVIPD